MSCCQTRNHQDPLFRFFEREVKMGGKMLQDVRQDLSDVVQVCQGKKKQTNYLRTLISDLVKGKFCFRNLIDDVRFRSSGRER